MNHDISRFDPVSLAYFKYEIPKFFLWFCLEPPRYHSMECNSFLLINIVLAFRYSSLLTLRRSFTLVLSSWILVIIVSVPTLVSSPPFSPSFSSGITRNLSDSISLSRCLSHSLCLRLSVSFSLLYICTCHVQTLLCIRLFLILST